MARDKVILREDKLAKTNLENAQFFFVQINTEDTLELATSGTAAYVLEDNPKKGEFGTFAIVGIAKVKCAETIQAGERVASNNLGEAQVWKSGQFVAGQALEKGESTQIISIIVPGPAKA